MVEEKKINRRDYLKYTGAAIGGLVVGGALGYLAKPTEVAEKTVTAPGTTVTVPTTITTTVATAMPVTITFAEPSDTAEVNLKSLIKKWSKLRSDVIIEHVPLPTTADEQYRMLVTRLEGKVGPDIFILDDQWIAPFAEAGWVYPIDEQISLASIKAQYLPNIIETVGIYKGHLWGLPYWPDVHVTFYRKDLLEKYGFEPPKTWDDLINTATAIMKKEENMIGYTWMGMEYEGLVCFFLWVLWSFGGEWIDQDGKVRINEPPAIEALQLLYDLIHKYRISPEGVLTYAEEEARMPFHEGRAIFHTNWTYVWGTSQAEDSPIKDKIWLTTNPHPPDKKPASIIGAWFLGINRDTKYLDKVIDFYMWYTNYENEKWRMLSDYPFISVRKDIYEDSEILEKWPHAKVLYEVEQTARARPRHPKYAMMSKALSKYVHAALTGSIEPKTALDKLADETKQIIGS